MSRARTHIACASWVFALCLASLSVAYAQDVSLMPMAPPSADATTDFVIRFLISLGVPSGLAFWLGRLVSKGIVVRLSDEDRDLLRKPRG